MTGSPHDLILGEPGPVAAPETDNDRVIARLEHDLAFTRLYLQSPLEERDARKQERVSANEEIQSANEDIFATGSAAGYFAERRCRFVSHRAGGPAKTS